jgi:hypothetical protein
MATDTAVAQGDLTEFSGQVIKLFTLKMFHYEGGYAFKLDSYS